MSVYKLSVAALLLLVACGPPPQERARVSALHHLQHELRSPARFIPESLTVYDFSREQVSYFSSEVPTFGDGHLVTYEASKGTEPVRRRALFVADNDSAFFYLPARHEAEFTRRYQVQMPAPVPTPH